MNKRQIFRLSWVIAAGGFLLLRTIAVYAEEKDSRPNCAKMQNAIQRLACYDSAFGKSTEENVIDEDELAARKAAAAILIDPESARFGQFTKVSSVEACLTVNARNTLGGYSGNQEMALLKGPRGWFAIRTIEAPVLKKDSRGEPIYLMSAREACVRSVTGLWKEVFEKQAKPAT